MDFTFLREQGLIEAKRETLANGKEVGKKHYRVAYTMVIKVTGRDLRCEHSFYLIPSLIPPASHGNVSG